MPFSVTVNVFWCELYKKVNMKLDKHRLKISTSKMKFKLSVLFCHWGDKISVAISLSCEIFNAVSAEKSWLAWIRTSCIGTKEKGTCLQLSYRYEVHVESIWRIVQSR